MLVKIPNSFSAYLGGKTEFTISAATVEDVEDVIEKSYPELHKKIYTQAGDLKKHIRLFADGVIVNSTNTSQRQIEELVIVSAVSGG